MLTLHSGKNAAILSTVSPCNEISKGRTCEDSIVPNRSPCVASEIDTNTLYEPGSRETSASPSLDHSGPSYVTFLPMPAWEDGTISKSYETGVPLDEFRSPELSMNISRESVPFGGESNNSTEKFSLSILLVTGETSKSESAISNVHSPSGRIIWNFPRSSTVFLQVTS